MMRANKSLMAILMSAAVLMVSACDSGGDAGGDTPPSSQYVSGSFKESSSTSVYFGKMFGVRSYSPTYLGYNGQGCVTNNNDYYFESDRVLVFGSRSLPESDFKIAATWVDGELDSTLAKMDGLTFNELVDARTQVWPELRDATIEYLSAVPVSGVGQPDGFDDMDKTLAIVWSTRNFDDASPDKQLELINLMMAGLGITVNSEDAFIEKKLYVCLHESQNMNQYGEGSLLGLNIAAPSINTPNKVLSIVRHELIHTAQISLYRASNNFALPKWFSEGQATYLSGQDVADRSSHNDYHVTRMVYFSDLNNIDTSVIYPHFALAYKYLEDANGSKSMIGVIKGMSQSAYNMRGYDEVGDARKLPKLDYNYNDGYSPHVNMFINSFDKANLKDDKGNELKLKRWKSDYDIILN